MYYKSKKMYYICFMEKTNKINGIEYTGEIGCFIISADGDVCGTPDYSGIKKLPFYKRILCRLFKRYKHKHMNLLPIKIDNE